MGSGRRVDFGVARLCPDPERQGGWTLLVDGVAQSYVDSANPTYLDFEYMRRFAAVIDLVAPAGQPLRVLHLGGGAFTMPRFVAATRRGSRQEVVERDASLVTMVSGELPLPAGIEVRIADARAALEATASASVDLVLSDVYQAAQMPRSVASVEYARHVSRVLRPGGWYAANVADLPPLAFTRVQAATLLAVFPDVCVIAEPGMLRGRRYGNVILAAAHRPGETAIERLTRAVAHDVFPARLLHGATLDRFLSGARAVTDAIAGDGPTPPPSLL